jgi:predicted CXXCH cytochrome family protein
MKKLFFVISTLFFALFLISATNHLPDKEGENKFKRKKKEPISCAECHSDLTQLKYKHDPATDACDNCHNTESKDHPDGVGKEFKLADEMPTLCYMCHETTNKKYIHGPIENGDCSVCHSPHSSQNRHLLTNESINGLCFECHDLEIGKNNKIHTPVEMGSCDDCHAPHESNNKTLLKNEKSQLCFNCHDNVKDEVNAKHPHAAAIDDCSNCHDAHSSVHNNLLRKKVPFLCYDCHDSFDEKYKHVPVEDGDCFTCHAVHGSINKKLLTEKEASNLCLMCHDLEMENDRIQHAPVVMGECIECHNAHSANYSALLHSKKQATCAKCHSEHELISKMENLHYPYDDDCANCHSAHSSKYNNLLIDDAKNLCFTCHDNIQKNLENKSIKHLIMNDSLSCLKCHSPHASKEPAVLLKKEKVLCLNCHNKEFGPIKNMKKHISESKYIHDPVKESCSSCHNSHASDYPYLTKDFFIPIKYAPANVKNFDLCFNCHNISLMNLKRSVIVTRFRNGDNNLHYVHLTGQKARNCNLCHDVHASDQERLIKNRSQFGEWKMPIEYKSNLNGGTCLSGCHEKKEYKIIPDEE